ncbi:hypothetical protein P4388_33165 [Bacillus thuringiensis]|nr:hypothetical protein [Bacillus thuringiensis]
MYLKKCGFLLVFVMMFCFALPSFASANSYIKPVKVGEDLLLVQTKGYGTTVVINEKYTNMNNLSEFVVDLGESTDLNSIKMHSFNNGKYRGT